MEAKNVISQEEKLNATNLEGIHYKYKYHPEYKRCDIEFEIDETCDQRIFNFIENLYQNSKGSNFQLDAIQDDKQKAIMELLLKHKPASNTNRPISAEIKIHEAKFSIKITSKKNMLTEAQKIQLIRHWNVPNLPTHFIGRESSLTEIAQRLNLPQAQITNVVITACHGLGGIGKTFLAVRYAQLHIQDYSFILWFNAESETTLINDYRLFAEAIQLPVEKQPSENIVMIVKNWLRQQSNWLIIYDNAPEDKLITKFRPANGGKILITSRKDSWGKKESLAIDVFTIEEARDYIVELTGFALSEYQVVIDEFAKTLGYLPLALAQACAYIAVNHLSLGKYLTLYAESRAEMLADKTMPAETNHEPVAITWNITFKAIEKQNSAASALLESCVFLQGNSIPEFLLKELFAKKDPELAKQEKLFIDVMRCLEQYSMLKLISQEKEEKLFSLHNLVQEVIIDTLSIDKKQTHLLGIILLLQINFPYLEIERTEDLAKQQLLLPHLEKIRGQLETWIGDIKKGRVNKDLVELLTFMIEEEWHSHLLEITIHGNISNDLPELTNLVGRALKIKEQFYKKGEINKELIELLVSIIEIRFYVYLLQYIAHGYDNLGDARKQKELLELALIITEQFYGKNHLKVVTILVNLSTAYAGLEDRSKSNELLERALVIQEKHYGEDHPKVADTLSELSISYGALKDVNKHKERLERALVIQENHYGKDHLKVAFTLANLGATYGVLGNASKQQELQERALVIQEKHYGKDHPKVANILGMLSSAYGALGDTCKQKEQLKRALAIQEKHYGKDHPKVAAILTDLGNIYGALRNAHRQKELLERVLKIDEDYYGKDHPEIIFSLVGLGSVYEDLGDVHKQKALLERALEICENHYKEDHPTRASILNNLSSAYRALGDTGKEKELLEQALVIKAQYYGKDHPVVATTLTSLSHTYGASGNARKQKELLERALVINQNHYGNNHLIVARICEYLAVAHATLDEWVHAKLAQEHAYHIYLTHPNTGIQHPSTQAAKAQLEKINAVVLAKFSAQHIDSMTSATEKNSLDLVKALRNAANQNNVEKLKELLSQGIDVNAKDDGQYERTALHWAVINQALPCIKLLLAAGADIMMVDNAGKSSVDYASENPIPDALFLLLSHRYKSSLDVIDLGKVLRRAVHEKRANDVKLLLKHIKNVNERDTSKTQRTALHWAVIQEATDCIEGLLMAGADPTIVDASGKTALDYAKGKVQILELLQKNQKTPNMQIK